jgi:hypothetical protein
MAMSERLAYILTFDTSSGVKSLEHLGSTADKELAKAEKRLDKVGTGLKRFGAGAMAAAGLAGAALFKMGQGAADADANMSALEQVVGEVSASAIGKWAEDSAMGVGLASKSAVEASTQFAGLGKIIGLSGQELADFATAHVELAADFAAFKNVSPEQSIQDITSAYAGSTEVLRKYNIFLDDRTLKEAYARETGEQVTGTLTTQQRIIAINSELYRQGADMIGQWGRESGELSGQQAILRAELTNLSDEIGAGVLPMMVGIFGAVNKVVGAMGSMDAATNGMVGKFAALAVGGVALLGAMSMIVGQAITMRANLALLAGKFTGVTKALVALKVVMMAHPIMAFAAVALGVAAALRVFGGGADAAAARVDDLAASMRQAESDADALTDAVLGLANDSEALRRAMIAAGVDTDEVGAAFLEGGDAADEMGVRLLEGAAAAGVSGVELAALATTLTHLKSDTAAAIVKNEELTEVTANVGDAAVVAAGSVDGYGDSLDDMADATDQAAQSAEDAAASLERHQQAIEGVYTATMAAIDSSLGYRNQQASTADAIVEATAVMAAAGAGTAEYEQAARDAEGAVLQQAAAAVRLASDQAEAAGGQLDAKEKTAIYRDELERMSGYLQGATADAINDHISRLESIPDRIPTQIEVDTRAANASLDGLMSRLRGIGSSVELPAAVSANRFRQRKSGGPVPGGKSDAVPIMAHGGEYVLDAGTVDAIKKGTPSAGRNTGGPIGGGSGQGATVTINNYRRDLTSRDVSLAIMAAELGG